jgi:hypothetical protein
MTNTQNLYQSILSTLGRISSEDLTEVDNFLKQLLKKKERKEDKKNKILEFAGIWKDDFDEELFEELTTGLPNKRLREDAEIAKLHRMAKAPTPDHIPLEVVAEKQGYDSDKLGEILDDIDYDLFADESLEDMLNTLTK